MGHTVKYYKDILMLHVCQGLNLIRDVPPSGPQTKYTYSMIIVRIYAHSLCEESGTNWTEACVPYICITVRIRAHEADLFALR